MALTTLPNRHDIEVSLRSDGTKAIVEGKTVVPFKTFVMLVIQRKVTALFKDWGTAPVVVDAELLTSLAGAPQDSQENRVHLVLVTLGIGVITGVLAFAILQFALLTINISMGKQELAILAGGLVGVGLVGSILSKVQLRGGGQRVLDSMEKAAALLSKK
ncbi:MAG: hypothetical protein Greene041662_348 [Candidatus Peregrinibacteria bacterium Greene0416_62]|nr:MAG: hypothetical protein Greene041662_348 [Candidatus Peregrinibacteria bacterium Greene0416_62]TSD00287.1 MAG: hypothetical protein Greene101449_221 [Candidatus Peregrinibacteria bacterium Greene1014_49]